MRAYLSGFFLGSMMVVVMEGGDDTKQAVTAIPANLGVFVGIRSMSWCDFSGLAPPITLVLSCNIQVSFSRSSTFRNREVRVRKRKIYNCYTLLKKGNGIFTTTDTANISTHLFFVIPKNGNF